MKLLKGHKFTFYPRFYFAVAIVACLLGSAVAVDGVVDTQGGSSCVEPFEFNNASIASRIAAGDYYEGEMGPFEDEAPEGFIAEVADAASAERVYVAAEGSVVALEMGVERQRIARFVRSQMEARGWVLIESGSEMRFSAVKKNGSYRWAYVDVSGGEERSMATFVLRDGWPNGTE